jgi:hypothetical protein
MTSTKNSHGLAMAVRKDCLEAERSSCWGGGGGGGGGGEAAAADEELAEDLDRDDDRTSSTCPPMMASFPADAVGANAPFILAFPRPDPPELLPPTPTTHISLSLSFFVLSLLLTQQGINCKHQFTHKN